MIITNVATCLRPYGVNGKSTHKVYFYNESGVIYATRAGWIEKETLKDLKESGYLSSCDIKEIDIKEPIRKIKKNFNCKENFYIKAEKAHDWECSQFLKDEYDLYIYVDSKNVKVEKVAERTQEEEGSTYINNMHYTEFLVTGITEVPFSIVKREILETKDTKEKTQANKILEIIKEKKLYINLSDYDLCKLLKVFDIVEKN